MTLTANAEVSTYPPDKRNAVLAFIALSLILLSCLDVRPPTRVRTSSQPTRKLQEAQFVHSKSNATAPSDPSETPKLLRACGPAELSGRILLGNSFSNWLPWSQIRHGTSCHSVKFRHPFTNVHDIRLFLSADRTLCDRDSHLTPIVWAERVSDTGFDACVHLSNDFDEQPKYWQEKVVVAWWALDSESPPSADRRYLGRVITSLEHNHSVCLRLPEEVNPHSNTVLTATSHPGISYEHSYSYRGPPHTERESVISWLDERNNSTFAVCTKRLYEKTPGRIDGAGVDVMSIRRNKRYTGLTKIRLGSYGRGCIFVDVDLTKVGSADDESDELPMILVQPRLNQHDRDENGSSPHIVAWVEHKLARGFTVCAKNLDRGIRRARHTIQIHWIAVHGVPRGMDRSLCREGAVDA